MSFTTPPKTVLFGCQKCHSFYPTLERGLQHLRHSPSHTSETLDLLDRYGSDYRAAAARTLISFTIHSEREHAAAIAQADLDVVQQSVVQHAPRGGDFTYTDNSNRSQNVTNRTTTTNVFLQPITVRVTLGQRAQHAAEDFTFVFARDKHTSIDALLRAVEDAYRGDRDVAALGAERLMMKLLKKNGDAVGGRVVADSDVWDLSRVVGGGWVGLMEIG